MSDAVPLLSVENVSVEFRSRGRIKKAVDGVDLTIGRGETLGLVGESGSGKTTLGRAIMGLVTPTSGTIKLDGLDITHLRGRSRRPVTKRLQVVFQDPYSSLNPAVKIGQLLREPLRSLHVGRAEADRRVAVLLDRVGLAPSAADLYVGSFSGGQRQRLAIARALISGPGLVVCDEAVSALDLSVQAQVLNLLRDLQAEFGVSYLFIGHNLDVVRYMSDRIAVLYHGRILEQGPADEIASAPEHPYTQALIAAALHPDPEIQRERRELRLRGKQSA